MIYFLLIFEELTEIGVLCTKNMQKVEVKLKKSINFYNNSFFS